MLAMDHIEAPYLAELKLGDDPTVVVIGAYKGDTVAFIREHHPTAFIYAFEPQKWAATQLVERFPDDPYVYVYPQGLGAGSRSDVLLYEYDTDAASILELPGWRKCNTVELLDASILKTDYPHIDLCVMNIEGYEYTLIPYMLGLDILPDKWLIQWHFQEKYKDQLFFVRDDLVCKYYKGTAIGKGWELWQKE